MKMVSRTPIPHNGPVYNLHIDQNHNYVANGAVVSNCHGAKAKVLHQLISKHGSHIAHRFGLTGTLPDNTVDALLVAVVLGEVIYEKPTHELIAEGWLAVPTIEVMVLDDMGYLKEKGLLQKDQRIVYEEEQHLFKTSIPRTKWIASFISGLMIPGNPCNTLVLVGGVKYGKMLAGMIPNSKFLYGNDDVKLRESVYQLFEEHDDITVICTKQIASVGLSIDRIFNLISVDQGKSFINTIQTIGRGLRKGRGKDSINVYDICGNLPTSETHTKKRKAFYKKAKYKTITSTHIYDAPSDGFDGI